MLKLGFASVTSFMLYHQWLIKSCWTTNSVVTLKHIHIFIQLLELERLCRDTGLQLFLSSVNYYPPPENLQMVGFGFIHTPDEQPYLC